MSDKEEGELYLLIVDILTSSQSRYRFHTYYIPLAQYGFVEEDLVHYFYIAKVLQPAREDRVYAHQYVHTNALCGYYRLFLIDRINEMDRRIEMVPVDDVDVTPGSPDDPDPVEDLYNGKRDRHIAYKAREFLGSSEEWVRLYLALSWCPEYDSIPLCKIGKRYQIASYHVKAQKLGITLMKSDIGDFAGYKDTMLGQWLTGLGTKVHRDNRDEINCALEILCLVALSLYKET
ncbi:MAG TPA: hypothetical protein ENI68_11340 [Gammaproteobacteria bacterium]|nr:hypothetical protein [Gammaproteobacteria bacterium]